jgi:hypothetical protein
VWNGAKHCINGKFMYVNGNMRPVATVSGMRGGGYKG